MLPGWPRSGFGIPLASAAKGRRPKPFFGEIYPGMTFDTLDDWISLYRQAGLVDVEASAGPFEMMTPAGFLADEGVVNSLAVMGRTLSRPVYLKKMTWLMSRMQRVVPYLGYVTVTGIKPG